jgi:Na+/H+-dicarboxylate symporter
MQSQTQPWWRSQKKTGFLEFIPDFSENAFEAMATNNILQILVHCSLELHCRPSAKGYWFVGPALAEMMLQITHYVLFASSLWCTGSSGIEKRACDPRDLPRVG